MVPRVSVIVPNYNHAPFLRQRLESILGQTYRSFEIILLDDCSTDNSIEVLSRYENHEMVSALIVNNENSRSTFNQWKKGIELARGEIIWIAESDDYIDLNFLETLVPLFDQYKSINLAFCQSKVVDEHDNVLRDNSRGDDVRIYQGASFIQDRMLLGNAIYNASMALFRKESVTTAIISSLSTYRYCGDWLFWGKLLQNGDVCEFENSLNFFRSHSNNVSNSSEKEGLFFIEGYTVFLTLAKDISLIKKIRLIRSWSFKCLDSNFDSKTLLHIFTSNFPKNIMFILNFLLFNFSRLFNTKRFRLRHIIFI